ncbi:MAG: hypothetical protein Q6360_13120 [Candidatus Brocadiales bacterium]|nr:hypothetical protein [Candidatus Brocadiales bacterium]
MPNEQKMQQFLDLLDGKRLSDEQVVRILKLLMDFAVKTRESMEKMAREKGAEMSNIALRMKGDADASLSEMKGKMNHLFVQDQLKAIEKSLQTTLDERMRQVETRVNLLKDGEKGAKGERGERGEPGKSGQTPNERDIHLALKPFIEDLKKEWDEKLKKLSQRPVQRFGAIGDAHVAQSFGRMFRTETPTGAIDGANTTYTVTTPINQVISFGINGMVIHDNEYTFANRTVTMTTALPAGLSGTTFRIVYV